ncbi:MAG TPA: peptide ABC transporter substrate-binding protein [Opitutaceae bacterium]|nr:peptide ABC transporter substrate-binding protein [Opitutaceae bacterium]
MKSRLLGFLPLLLLLAGCGRRESAVERGDRAQVLHRGISYEVAGLDPQLATGISEGAIETALFEGLVAEDPKDLHPVPGVAERWEASADGLTYTFRLRADARWSNGRPVTAGDFVASWRRILSPALAAPNAAMLYVLQGAEAYHRGAAQDFGQVGVAAPDPRTLRVTLDHATPDFLARLTHWAWLPVYLPAIRAAGKADDRANAWARPGRLVGNGAFLLQSWSPDREIVLARSPTYWDARRVALREIHLYPIDSVDAEERAFRAGQLHVTDAVPIGRIDAYRRDAPQLLRIDPYLGTYYYALNVRHPSFGDPRVRRALSLAIDRGAIAAKVLRGVEQPAASFTPPGLEGYEPPAAAKSDAAEARRLLAEAGHPGGQGLAPLELMFNSSENHRLIAEAVQEMWRRELGIEVKLVNQENKVVLADRQSGDFQIVRAAWIADYPSPSSFLDLFRSGNGNNFTGWSSPEYDALLFAADRAADPAARRELWGRAEALLLRAAPIIPLYHYSHAFLIQPSVQGWYPNLLDHHPYKYVWLDGK